MTWKERFLRFLKEEGVYGEWIYNLKKQHPTNDVFFWKFRLKEIFSEENQCEEGISSAFCWSYTIQGYNFWLKLCIKWIDKCRNSVYKI